jgi:hypothetical protein
MDKEKGKRKNYVKFHVARSNRLLYKTCLEILEDIRDLNQISEYDYQRYRKKILDRGNDCERESCSVIDEFLDYNG